MPTLHQVLLKDCEYSSKTYTVTALFLSGAYILADRHKQAREM